MKITEQTIKVVFDNLRNIPRYRRFNNGFEGTLVTYRNAESAFAHNSPEGFICFDNVYNTLKYQWRVFRGSHQYWTAKSAYEKLVSYDLDVRSLSLSNINNKGDNGWRIVWECINGIREIKQNQNGPSLVAISKFLHFWNPRLFLIYDDEIMAKWVFRHNWLSSQLEVASYDDIINQLLNTQQETSLTKYLRLLLFSRDLIKCNPSIMEAFNEHAQILCRNDNGYNILENYEARAVELFLIGLVELPPNGVDV